MKSLKEYIINEAEDIFTAEAEDDGCIHVV